MSGKVPAEMFAGCEILRKLRLPDHAVYIGMDAFKNCSGLQEIRLPARLERIGATAFWGCSALTEIQLPEGVKVLDEAAFANCTGLKRLRLSANLRKLGRCAFQNCTALESVEIPAGVKALPLGVFAGCRNLKRIVIPDTVEHIDPYAFYLCDALKTVVCADPDRFARALEITPFGRKRWAQPEKPARFPMELLHWFAGEVSGSMLTAMGHPQFDIDRKFRFLLTDRPGIMEVRARPLDAEYPADAHYDRFFVDDTLKPVN